MKNNQTIFNAKKWMLNFKTTLLSENLTSGRRKLYNSLWAIVIGLILSLIIISFNGTNPFEFLGVIFDTAFGINGDFFTTILLVYVFGALAVGIGFKAGLFNIGVAGQMMFGGLLAFIYLISSGQDTGFDSFSVSGGQIFAAILIAVIGGTSVALVAGVLKAYFKVHEVVSTILLNWMVFYLASWATSGSSFKNPTTPDVLKTVQVGNFFFGPGWIVLSIFLVLIAASSFFFIFKKTTFGYKIKAVGFNPDASEYAGINKKLLTMIIFAISGAFSGFAGFFFYFVFRSGNYSIELGPLLVGFDSIAISLLAYNSPIGIVASAFFYSILTNGNSALQSSLNLDPSVYQIIIGIIIYFASISVIFNKFQVITLIKNIFIFQKNKVYNQEYQKYKKTKIQYKSEFKKFMSQIKLKEQKQKSIWKKMQIELKAKNNALLQELHNLRKSNTNNERIIEIYSLINSNTKDTNKTLNEKGFYEKQDLKNLYKAKFYELKTSLQKAKKQAINQFYNNKKNLKLNKKGVK